MAKKKIDTQKRTKQNKKKKEELTEEITEIVDDMYEGEGADDTLVQPRKHRKGGHVLAVLLIMIVGFLSGIVGELAINNYLHYQGYDLTKLWQPPVAGSDEQQVIVFKKEEVQQEHEDQTKMLLETAGQSVVGIYLKRGGSELVDQLYRPKDKVGNALVLTSDGWLVTTESGMPEQDGQELVIITPDNTVAELERVLLDEASGVVFLKAAAENLKVVKFAESNGLFAGLPVSVFSEKLVADIASSHMTSINTPRAREIVGFGDSFVSTEQYERYITLNDLLGEAYEGSPVIDLEGGIIGLYAGGDDARVIPAMHFTGVFNTLLKTDIIERPYIGLQYLDLSASLGLPENISEGLKSGALIFGDQFHGVTAVALGSPAEEAGISIGDIVLKVNDDIVDERHSLTELLQQYKIGDVVKLTIQNNGSVREVDLSLIVEEE